MQKRIILIGVLSSIIAPLIQSKDCHSHAIFVPRQLSYNPVYENALVLNNAIDCDWHYLISVKPIYTQSVGSSFNHYFSLCQKACMNVQENGSGDISSLWFKVISSDPTMYSSQLSFSPVKRVYGGLLYGALRLPCDLFLSINTALIGARNTININENNRTHIGTVAGFRTIIDSFANPSRLFGKICGTQSIVGVDDIQIKLAYELMQTECSYWNVYGLLGIPTGKGSRALYLFEPLIGSRHAQLGLGTTAAIDIVDYDCGSFFLEGELKWRYGFKGRECRSFDLCENGDWSRYMLFVNETAPFITFPAINTLTFSTKVTPRSSLDLYLAAHWTINQWHMELGYDFWYRSKEKVIPCTNRFPNVGMADLVGIAAQDPHTASTANISQGVLPGPNQMTSDPTFIPITLSNVDCNSGAQPQSISNTVYASVGHMLDCYCHPLEIGLNFSYEKGSSINTPDAIAIWANIDIYF